MCCIFLPLLYGSFWKSEDATIMINANLNYLLCWAKKGARLRRMDRQTGGWRKILNGPSLAEATCSEAHWHTVFCQKQLSKRVFVSTEWPNDPTKRFNKSRFLLRTSLFVFAWFLRVPTSASVWISSRCSNPGRVDFCFDRRKLLLPFTPEPSVEFI